jgi:GTP-binding protein
LKEEIAATFPEGLPHIFFSSVSQENIFGLKDVIWQAIHRTPDDEIEEDLGQEDDE